MNFLKTLLPEGVWASADLQGLSMDSRQVTAGDLFLARSDQYIDEAIERGAAMVLTSGGGLPSVHQGVPVIPVDLSPYNIAEIAARFNDCPAKKMQIIGVTGTSGKTSCTQFLAGALRSRGLSCGVIGTLGAGWGESLQSTGLTTPDAVTLQRLLADFLKHDVKYTAMEVSSHALHQGRVEGIPFSVGVFTNLSRDHLDYHSTMAAYGAQKKKLFQQSEVAVVNVNDAFGRACLPLPGRYIACGTDRYAGEFLQTQPKDCQVMAADIRTEEAHFSADVRTPWGSGHLHVPLPGFFNFENALLVLSTLCVLNTPFNEALDCIAALKPVPGRMQIFGGAGLPHVVVDYAHKPDALLKVLESLRAQCSGRLTVVFGCGGERDAGKRPQMGDIAERYTDRVILTDDNARYEDPAAIIADILHGMKNPLKATVLHDRRAAIADALKNAEPEDYILVAGKGAEETQTAQGVSRAFNDAAVVCELLKNDG